jgi:beta-mannosidase
VAIDELGIRHISNVRIEPGMQRVESVIEVNNPRLWWPVGQGEQKLYGLRVILEVDGQVIDSRKMRIGFRRVRVDQSPHPQDGQYFNFEINGRKVFFKGSNFVPPDSILARVDRARYERLIELALESNFNFLRVWGGGQYESDDFYQLCDERGILVWQEFAFACSRYPATDEMFFNNVKAEAVHNIRRLAGHPSLIAWCGNNEIEWGDWDWDYGRKGTILPDHGLFHVTLRRLVAEEDPTRYYQPSSPYSPPGVHPNDERYGDQHPWSVGFFQNDFRDYRRMICRFPDEGGVLGPTSLPTMKACLGGEGFLSLAWQLHDNSVATWTQPSAPDEMIRQWLGKEPREMSVEEFTYWAGLLQGEALREYIENFRRRMFDSGAAVFWMFNDCWPAVRSWTTVDYFLRRTPAFHAVRRAMADVHVVIADEGQSIGVYGINDTAQAVSSTVEFGVFGLSGDWPHRSSRDVELRAGGAARVASFDKSQWPRPQEQGAFATLMRDGNVVSRNRLFLPQFSEMKWPRPEIRVRIDSGEAIFECDVFTLGVCVDLSGQANLSDNFFDLYPGTPHRIRWEKDEPPKVLFVGNVT